MLFGATISSCAPLAGTFLAKFHGRPHVFLLLALIIFLPMPAHADLWGGGTGDENTNRFNELLAAAEQGSFHSQFLLGTMYDAGKGAPQDYSEAARWYRMAAERGYDKAQNNLGAAYEDGRGVPRDYGKALGWYRKAAEQGLTYAQFNLAEMYIHGRGVEVSLDQARNWYRKAALQGYAKAVAALAALDSDRLGENAAQPRFSSEPPLETCIKQVQKELPGHSFDAYMEKDTVKMFGTPESFFKFRKCMSMSGVPLADK